jgi:peptide/nickel transport system permease protein
MAFSVAGFSVPVFVLAYFLDHGVLDRARVAAGAGLPADPRGAVEWARHLVLPSLALGTVYIALIARMTRAAMLDVLAQDYVRTAPGEGARAARGAQSGTRSRTRRCRSRP